MKQTKKHAQRNYRLHIRVNKEEKGQITSLAKEHGLNISDFVRVTVGRSKPVMPKAKPDRALFITSLGQLNKLANNVNQIAHELNRQCLVGCSHTLPEGMIEETLSGVKALSGQLLSILMNDLEK